MKEYIDSIDWSEIWEFSKQFILPNIGWFIFWLVLFIILGLILGIVFNVFLYRKNIFTRDRKYYNWIAKLWIPYFMIVFLYFSAMIGLFYGGHSVLKSENKNITANIYSKTIGTTFSSEKEKKDFLHTLQTLSNSSEDVSKSMTEALAIYIKQNNSGFSSVDNFKNSSTSYLLKKYESEVYSACVYGFMKVVDDKANMKNVKDIDYTEFKSLLQKLDQIEPQRIELSIQSEMGRKLQAVLDYIFKEILKHELFFFLLFLIIPFIEYFIYLKFIKTKESDLNGPKPVDNIIVP
ncbi:chloride channel protein [Flavobacterium sp. JAS]|uniref:chloride channel protein n=1 Tax=Flavobacterium sp. JAS TaxID=2897329 RepID=UPI001E2AEC76|nr:chloride channel protein [Flavobacterium sp. JAS]MCD0471526.1 chloride channel protein [Flavobacterium sp. JAS]